MKKILIGALVGGLLAFTWQTLSHTALDLHRDAERYTPRQDSILAYLSSQLGEDGDYFMPNLPPGSSNEERMKMTESANGKPWAIVSYHRSWSADMTSNILRGLLVAILMAGMLTWILMQMKSPSFSTVMITCLFVGLFGYLNFPYAEYIWYRGGGLYADLVDAVMMWGLCGLWLGWWVRRK